MAIRVGERCVPRIKSFLCWSNLQSPVFLLHAEGLTFPIQGSKHRQAGWLLNLRRTYAMFIVRTSNNVIDHPAGTHKYACHPEERRGPRGRILVRGAQATKDPSPEPVIQRSASDEGSFAGACHPEERKRRRIPRRSLSSRGAQATKDLQLFFITAHTATSAYDHSHARARLASHPAALTTTLVIQRSAGAPADGSLSAGCKRRRIPRRSLSSRGAQATKDLQLPFVRSPSEKSAISG